LEIQGAVLPLLRAQVDTDLIIRIERLATLSRGQFGVWAFESIRYTEEGKPDVRFPMNWAACRGASILLAGENFGCGSSRENAVWALQEAGIRLLVAPSFGEIFLSNCRANRLAAVTVDAPVWNELRAWAEAIGPESPPAMTTARLDEASLILPNGRLLPVSLDRAMHDSLLSEEDELDRANQRLAAVGEFARALHASQPWLGPPIRS
jgi:3-isopropylmalate/(R)-2-methylmalate dehydratase small subunit